MRHLWIERDEKAPIGANIRQSSGISAFRISGISDFGDPITKLLPGSGAECSAFNSQTVVASDSKELGERIAPFG